MNVALRIGTCIAIVAAILLGFSYTYVPVFRGGGGYSSTGMYIEGVGRIMGMPLDLWLPPNARSLKYVELELSVKPRTCRVALVLITSSLAKSISAIVPPLSVSNITKPSAVKKLLEEVDKLALCRGTGFAKCRIYPSELSNVSRAAVIAVCSSNATSIDIDYVIKAYVALVPKTNVVALSTLTAVGVCIAVASALLKRRGLRTGAKGRFS